MTAEEASWETISEHPALVRGNANIGLTPEAHGDLIPSKFQEDHGQSH